MRNPTSALLSTLVLGLALAGCHKADLATDLVGSYKGKLDLPADAASNPLAKGFLSALSPTMELKKDKTFTMTMMFPFEGTYAVTGDSTFDLTMTKMMGMDMTALKNQAMAMGKVDPATVEKQMSDIQKPIHASVSADHKTFTMTMPNQGTGKAQSIVFTKNPSSS
jgi:predicted component of type VI protein secretion system